MELQMTPHNKPRTVADMPWEGQADSMRRSGFSAGEIEAARKKRVKKDLNAYNKANGIKKPPKARKEHEEMQDLKRACDGQWGKDLGIQYEIYLIPNSAPRGVQAASYFRSEGLREGYPDLGLDVASGQWHGLRIEMKRADGTGRTSDEQSKWHDRLKARGYCVVVPAGVQEAKRSVEQYLGMGQRP
jgi:hypothetical protein